MRKQLLTKFRAEKDKMPNEKKALVLTHFPRFLSLLEEEVYGADSPIWDPGMDFEEWFRTNESACPKEISLDEVSKYAFVVLYKRTQICVHILLE